MEPDDLTYEREEIEIEGGRKLYLYTFLEDVKGAEDGKDGEEGKFGKEGEGGELDTARPAQPLPQ